MVVPKDNQKIKNSKLITLISHLFNFLKIIMSKLKENQMLKIKMTQNK